MKRGGTSGLVGLYRLLREPKGDNGQRVRILCPTLKLRRENEFLNDVKMLTAVIFLKEFCLEASY